MPETFKCPKCGAVCEKCSEVVDAGVLVDVFQCENESCLIAWEFDGSTFPAAYTFVVGIEGVAHDPVERFDPLAN